MVNSKWIYNPRTIIIWIIWQIHHESLQLSHCDIGYLFLICDKSSETKTLHVMYYVFAYWLINIFVTLLKMHIFACWCHVSLQMINRMFTFSWKNSVWEREEVVVVLSLKIKAWLIDFLCCWCCCCFCEPSIQFLNNLFCMIRFKEERKIKISIFGGQFMNFAKRVVRYAISFRIQFQAWSLSILKEGNDINF